MDEVSSIDRPLSPEISHSASGLPRLRRSDAVRPHHFVVLVLDDVAVPDELAGRRERRFDAGDLARQRDDGVLAAAFPRLRPACRRIRIGLYDPRTGLRILVSERDLLPVDHLERYL